MGQEVNDSYDGIIIEVYTDGTYVKNIFMNRVATYIIAIISVALLIYNQVLIEDIKQYKITNIKLQYKVLDLQSEYDYLFDETLRLEDENQLLGSYVAYSDTLY